MESHASTPQRADEFDDAYSRRLFAENFVRVSENPLVASQSDLQRAESYLSGEIRHLNHKAWRGETINRDLLDSLDREAEWYKRLWLAKRDGR